LQAKDTAHVEFSKVEWGSVTTMLERRSPIMISAEMQLDVELEYAVSFRRVRQSTPAEAPAGRFELSGRQRQARAARRQRGGNWRNGIHRRGASQVFD
jgi:hypothetical protein